MAKRKFKASLSVDGIEQLKRDLLNYKDNILQQKVELLTSFIDSLPVNWWE